MLLKWSWCLIISQSYLEFNVLWSPYKYPSSDMADNCTLNPIFIDVAIIEFIFDPESRVESHAPDLERMSTY